MLDILFWIGVGLIIGWNLLPQPAWVEAIYDRVVSWFKSDDA